MKYYIIQILESNLLRSVDLVRIDPLIQQFKAFKFILVCDFPCRSRYNQGSRLDNQNKTGRETPKLGLSWVWPWWKLDFDDQN